MKDKRTQGRETAQDGTGTRQETPPRRETPLLRESQLYEILARALARRTPLMGGETTAYRLVDREADGVSWAAVDRYNDILVVHLYDDEPVSSRLAAADAPVRPPTPSRTDPLSRPLVGPLVAQLQEQTGARAVYLKHRPRSAARLSEEETLKVAPTRPARGTAVESLVVQENGMHFLIRPGAGLSTGLFLDMRDGREQVRETASGGTVLNLFAYTCGFGVAASLGGASRVLNLDAARPALLWGAENYALNSLPADQRDFVYGDAFDWLQRFARRGEQFTLVIADPPGFSTVKGRRFSASHDYADLAELCARVVAPGGSLLFCCNEARLSQRHFREMCQRGIRHAGRVGTIVDEGTAPEVDFPSAGERMNPLKTLLMQL